MRRRLSPLTILIVLLSLSTPALADDLAGILPVVGSTPGAQGARFKTGLQMTNPSAAPVAGDLVYRPQGGGAEVRQAFELAPRATLAYDDVVADMGATGLGSLEIQVSEGARPIVVARAFADGEGTQGVTVPMVFPEEALEAEQSATLLVPSDLSRFRFNIGVRSLGAGATLTVQIFDADGTLAATRTGLTYPENWSEQKPGSEFAGVDLEANQSIRIEVVAGSVIVYGTTTDNRTNDPSFQLDELLNGPPVLIEQRLLDQPGGGIRIELLLEDPDGDPLEIEIREHPAHGTVTAFELGADGWFSAGYAPVDPGAGRPDQIIIVVTDGQGNVRRIIIVIPGGGVNHPPTANDQSVATDEDVPVAITLSGSDPDGDALAFSIVSGPANGSLGAVSSSSDTTATVTYTPGVDFAGTDSFTFEVNDGRGGTDQGVVTITVSPVNDDPFATADSYSVLEDQVLTVAAPGVLANDFDPEGAGLTAQLVSSPASGTLAFNANGSFTYTPNANFFGSDAFSYRATDGLTPSAPATVTITVTAVNDAPSFTAGAGQTVLEDSGAASVAGWATAISAGPGETQGLTFLLSNDNNALFSAQPAVAADGTLTFTPAPNASGAANVTIALQDSGGTANGGIDTSPAQTFVITVTAVNDAPSFTKGADQGVLEDSGPATVASWATAISPGPADEAGQALTFNLSNDNNALFSAQPAVAADGTLTFTPAANANGVANVTVALQDNGGTANGGIDTSPAQVFVITVTAVNDAPSFTAGADQTVAEDAGPQNTAWATAVSPGPPDEAGQALAFLVSNGNNALFDVQPAIAADGTLTYTPAANAFGSALVTVSLQDDGGTANGGVDTSAPPATFTITVTPVNDAPTADSQSVTTAEDTPIPITLSASDIEGDALTFNAPSAPSIGTLGPVSAPSCSVTGGVSTCTATVTYTPNPDASGPDSFTFTVSDGAATSAAATVTITVTPVNDPPVGNPDAYGPIAHGTTLTVAAPGVVGNDADVDGDALSAILVAGPSFASAFTLNADGSFSYTHDRSANLSDSFTYNVSDGTAAPVGPITVSITINANQAPVAADDAFGVAEGGTLNVAAPGVMTNDADPEGFPTSAALVSGPSRGALTFNADGSFDYVHDGSSTLSDSFTYQITDGLLASAPATVTIAIAPVNDAPVAAPNAYSVARGGTLTVPAPGVLGNDTDEEGDPLTAALVAGPGASSAFTLNADGSLSYTHDGTAGTSDSFTYQASDGTDLSNVATVTIAITNVNQAPSANDDAYSVSDGGTLTIAAPGVIANDTDPEGNPLTAILDAGPGSAASFTLNADGSLSYQHDGTGAGTDTFTYHVSDGAASSNVATVTITITAAANVPPVATDDAYAIAQGGTLTIVAPGVLGNDTDAEGNPLAAALVSGPVRGSLTLNPDGSFTYVHSGSSTLSDTFTYVANDGQDDSNVATVTITINAANTAPTAVDDAYSTSQNLPLNVPAPGVLGNDTDPEGDALTPILGTGPSNGVLTLNADGSLTYIPAAGFFGPDSFTYFAFDGALQSATPATVSITVDPNAVPVANDDAFATDEELPLTVAAPGVLGNDTDGDSDPLTAALVTGPSNAASFTFNIDGSFDYTPAVNFNGSDTFTYRANDGVADSNVATVTITVNSVNDAPAGTDNAVTTDEDAAYAFAAADFGFTDPNDTPPDALLAVRIATVPGAGSLELSTVPVVAGQTVSVTDINAGNLQFVPAADANGTPYASFTFQVQDDGGTPGVDLDPTPNTMTVNVNAINDAPAGTDNTVTTNEDAGYTFAAADFGFTDPLDTPADALLSVVITTLPGAGTLTVSGSPIAAGTDVAVADLAGNLVFTPAANGSGAPYATFTFQVRDDGGVANGGVDLDPTPNTMTIDVTAINDAPEGTNGTVTAAEDTLYAFTVGDFGFTDPNDTPANNLLSVVITTLPGAGSLTLSSVPVVAGAEIPAANIGAGNLQFVGAPNAFGSPYTTFTFQVRDDGGVANGGVDLDPTPNTMTINVTPVNDAPAGGADAWDAFGNTALVVDQPALLDPHVRDTTGSGTGVLDNDADPADGDPVIVTGVVGCADASAPFGDGPACNTIAGGTVVVQANGSFLYTPQPGDADEPDSFQYVLTDVPANGAPLSVNVTVSLTLFEAIWYVDGSVVGPGTGVSTNPFNNFTAIAAGDGTDADDPFAVIFVHDSSVNGQIELETGQKLYGEGFGLSINRNMNGNGAPTILVPAGTKPVVTSGAGHTVLVVGNAAKPDRSGIEVRGLTLATSAAASSAIKASSADAAAFGITINDVAVIGSTADGIDIDHGATTTASVSIVDVALSSVASASGWGVSVVRTAGTLNTQVLNIAVDGNSGAGIQLAGPFNLTNGLGNVVVGDSGNSVTRQGVEITAHSGSLVATALQVFAGGGVGFRVAGVSPAASFVSTPNTAVVQANGGPAVDLSNVSGTAQFNSITSTGSPTTGVSINNLADGAVNALFSAGAGSITTPLGASGPSFNVNLGNAQIAYGGSITNNSATARAVSITGWAGDDGTDDLVLSGAIDENGAGILVNGNGGSRAITFSGGLDIDTTSGEGFAATSNTNALGLNITGTNDITAISATALRVTNTPIGAADLNFRNISSGNATVAPDPANGIVLNNTGGLGELIVTGNGGACTSAATCTGGAILNMTNDGITLTSTLTPSFTRMFIGGSGRHGIHAAGLSNGLTLTNSYVQNSGNADNEYGLNVSNVAGSIAISGTTFDNAADDLIHYVNLNTNGTLTVNGSSSFVYPGVVSGTANAAIALQPNGTSNLVATIQNNTFTNIVSSSIQWGAAFGGDSGTSTLDFSNNTITVNMAGRGSGFQLSCQELTTGNITIANNNFSGAGGNGVISIDCNDSSLLTGTVSGNVISNPPGIGMFVAVDEAAEARLTVNGNTVTNSGGDGIQVVNFGGVGISDLFLAITNNQVNGHSLNTAVNFVGGISVTSFEDNACIELKGNSVTGTPAGATQCGGAPCVDYYIEEVGGTMVVEEVPNTPDTTLTAAYVNSTNDPGPVTIFGIIDLTNGAQCPFP